MKWSLTIYTIYQMLFWTLPPFKNMTSIKTSQSRSHYQFRAKDADSMEKSWAFHQRWSKLRTSYFACLKSVPTPIFQNWCSEYPKAAAAASALRTNIHVYMPKQPLIFRKCSTFSHKSIIHCLKKITTVSVLPKSKFYLGTG